MSLSNLGLFRSLRTGKRNKQFVVIGLGRFGRAVCMTLHELGHEVLGVDSDERRVSQILTDQIASHAIQLDSTDPHALKEAGIFEFETAIVAIGNYIQESVITTLNLKEANVPMVVAKASSDLHGKVLKRVGADHVVFPEHEMGCNLARSLTRPGILDRFELDPNHSIVEVVVPAEFDGKSILELDLRSRYGLNVLAIIKGDQYNVNPNPSLRLEKGTLMVVIGENKGIDQLPV
ncbi:MAG TPA: TrkA family potassium uptake protein [Synechococcales cyanobacterium M55_K2018_004]|nr:TrkA family potassium uptake protein [Synechococcales cyanobacterium M55_K2018_004]